MHEKLTKLFIFKKNGRSRFTILNWIQMETEKKHLYCYPSSCVLSNYITFSSTLVQNNIPTAMHYQGVATDVFPEAGFGIKL